MRARRRLPQPWPTIRIATAQPGWIVFDSGLAAGPAQPRRYAGQLARRDGRRDGRRGQLPPQVGQLYGLPALSRRSLLAARTAAAMSERVVALRVLWMHRTLCMDRRAVVLVIFVCAALQCERVVCLM